ncbi:hypothetical protein M440DRAFT_1397662 [Trichoderma longibrachiatum ATCC 18648]|uniref:Uncharacterized protein n=1 Tax=Trichoderma longibrachiatum ATCC 18648 TaxID=983965 RepID=A0A2T4CFI8_TRILO|nr:hypothetical protein M440DRAFT_1397662 [Trichoderma longibrachiatum ATCC 18648]
MARDQMLYYLAEKNCFLCRNSLPYFAGVSPAARRLMTWEMHVLGFIDTSVDPSQGPKVFTFKTDLGDPQFIVHPTLTLPSHGGRITIAVVHERPRSKYRQAYFAHQACCKVVARLQRKLACRELYSLAVQTRELLPKDCWGQELPWHLASLAGTIETGIIETQSTSLGSCLSRCAKLPPELQNYILRYVQGASLASSLMTALHTSTASRCHSLATIPSHPSAKGLLPADHVNIAHVCASFATVFGRPYLTSLEIFHKEGHHDAANQQCLEIRIDAVRRVEFITGMHGISAIRFYFFDGSVSNWLGDARRGWRSRPIGVTRSDIYFAKHGQKAVVERFAELFARRPKNAPLQVLWDATWSPSKHGVPFVAQFFRHQLAERSSCFPGRPMCRYMPLQLDGEYARGITAYTTCFGISCIVVHRNDTHQAVSTPHKRGLPTTFYFRPEERIVTLGLVTTGYTANFQYGPFLMFKTNQNRIAYFGPPSSLSEPTARWVSLIPDQMKRGCAVMGLIVDQLAMMKGTFKTLGVCCKATEGTANLDETANHPSGLQVIRLALPEVLRKPSSKTDTVFTRARLSNIKQLRILHRDVDVSDPQKGLRWCGLWIHHHDGTTETLGLWDDFLTKNARIIYDAETDGPLKRIAFQLRRRMPGDGKPGQSEYVVKISAKVAPLDDTESNEDTSDPQNQVRSEPDVDGDRIIEFRTCVSQPVSI